MSLYRLVLKQTWEITWRHKFLWLFGFFATFWSVGSAYEIISQSLNLPQNQNSFFTRFWQELAANGINLAALKNLILTQPARLPLLVLIFAVTVGVILLFYWIFTCSQIALVRAFDKIEDKKQSIGHVFMDGRGYFWPVFGINVIGKILTGLLLLLLSYPIIKPLLDPVYSLGSFALYLASFIIIFLLIIIISLVVVYSIIHITNKNTGFFRGIAGGLKMLNNNWLISLETAFILFLVTIGTGLLLIICLILLSLPFLILLMVVGWLKSTIGYWLLLLLSAIIALTGVFIITSILTTFQLGVWVTLSKKIELGKAESKLQRMTGDVLGK